MFIELTLVVAEGEVKAEVNVNSIYAYCDVCHKSDDPEWATKCNAIIYKSENSHFSVKETSEEILALIKAAQDEELRDRFAIAFKAAMIFDPGVDGCMREYAKASYAMADEMMKARG